MVSPMQRRRLRLAKEQAQVKQLAANSPRPGSVPGGAVETHSASSTSHWDLIRGTLDNDKRQLKKIKPIAGKIEYKSKVLTNYLPYLERDNMPVDIKMILMVWLFDVGQIGRGLDIAIEAIENSYETPDFIKSSIPEFLADTVFAWAETQFKAGHSTAPYFDQVFKLVTEKFNTYEVITAKYYKLAGLMALGKYRTLPKNVSEPDNLKTALARFISAEQCYSKIGVGTRIAEVRKRLALLLEDTE